jgi:hypothetical protein
MLLSAAPRSLGTAQLGTAQLCATALSPVLHAQGAAPPAGGGSPAPPKKKDAPPAGGKAGHGTLEMRLGYYDNDDSPTTGNPVLDENLTVIEPVIYLDYNTTDTRSYWGKFSYDQV